MSRLKCLMTAASLVCAAGGAHAASPEAWAELYDKASSACMLNIPFDDIKVRGAPIDFEAVVLLIVDGRYMQPHMKYAKGTMYCLYNKQNGKVETSEQPVPVEAAATPAPAMGRTCWTVSFRTQLKRPRAIGAKCTAKNDEGDMYAGVVRR